MKVREYNTYILHTGHYCWHTHQQQLQQFEWGLPRNQEYMFTAESLRIGVRANWSLTAERLVEGPVQWRDDAKDNSPPAGLMVMKLDCTVT